VHDLGDPAPPPEDPWQAFFRVLWPRSRVGRVVVAVITALFVAVFAFWATLPDETKVAVLRWKKLPPLHAPARPIDLSSSRSSGDASTASIGTDPPQAKPRAKTTATKEHADTSAGVLVTCNLECELRIDQEPQRTLRADATERLALADGQHLVRASATKYPEVKWERTIDVPASGGQGVVSIDLASPVERLHRERYTVTLRGLVWMRTGWRTKGYQEDAEVCRKARAVRFAGLITWRLPSTADLGTLRNRTGEIEPAVTVPYENCVWTNSTTSGRGLAFDLTTGRSRLDDESVDFVICSAICVAESQP